MAIDEVARALVSSPLDSARECRVESALRQWAHRPPSSPFPFAQHGDGGQSSWADLRRDLTYISRAPLSRYGR